MNRKRKFLLCLSLFSVGTVLFYATILNHPQYTFNHVEYLDSTTVLLTHQVFSNPHEKGATNTTKGRLSSTTSMTDVVSSHPVVSNATSEYLLSKDDSVDVIHNLSHIVLHIDHGKTIHHIYSAYYDSRQLSNRPAIVMFGYVEHRIRDQIHCKFIYKDNSTKCAGSLIHTPLIAPNVMPESYFCKMGSTDKIPTHVALSASGICGGEWSTPIPVWNRKNRKKQDIGVCVQGALFTGVAFTNEKIFNLIVGFLAMVKTLGAKIVTIYNANVRHELLEQILKLYPGFVDMIQWENLYDYKSLHYGGQRVLLNDCLYRNMKRVRYLAFIDLDEVIYPVSTNYWMDMLQILDKKGKYASYTFPNNFMAEVPPNASISNDSYSCPYMNLPKYFVRLQRLPWPEFKQNTKMKMIVKPEALTALCIHDICKPTVGGYSTTYRVPQSIGIMAHYRVPVPWWYIYGKGVEDRTAMKYEEQVMQEMNRVCALLDT